MKLWQLKKISNNEPLNDPQPLPENWGPIFGLHGVKDRLHDLSWVNLEDQGWFEVEVPDLPPKSNIELEAEIKEIIIKLLKDSDYTMLPDVIMTKQKKSEWENYRRLLREIKYQSGYPHSIDWPIVPQ